MIIVVIVFVLSSSFVVFLFIGVHSRRYFCYFWYFVATKILVSFRLTLLILKNRGDTALQLLLLQACEKLPGV